MSKIQISEANHLVVVGGASLDTLHFGGRTVSSAGGAGLYTALSAQRAGAAVTMVGPKPRPVPEELAIAAEILDWRGQEVPPEQLPSFEIAHLGEGATEMVNYWWRAEADLSPETLPDDLPGGLLYCCPLADPALQLQFVRYAKEQGYVTACGTFAQAVAEQLEVVRETLDLADIFFCNRSEATALFGSLAGIRTLPGKLLFVTCSSDGALVVQGDHVTKIPGVGVAELDPTGAGDTFCGTVLAHLIQGAHPIRAAEDAVDVAAHMVTRVGPEFLLDRSSDQPRTPCPSVSVDSQRVEAVGDILKNLPDATAFDFTGDDYPPINHAAALDFFFAATLQQFGFWTTRDDAYEAPMYATIEDRRLKGSDFIWAAYRRWLDEDPEGLTPVGQSALDQDSFDQRLRSDAGADPLPSPNLHLQQARAYGRDVVDLDLTPHAIVANANASPRPLRSFLGQLDQVGGYKEDPLRKKSALLAAILYARPEKFLRWAEDEEIPPIIDYHLQRSCLRIGLVDVVEETLRQDLEHRRLVDSEGEESIRMAAYDALTQMQRRTGKSMAALDWFFFQNRHRCPEMTDPVCSECPVDSVCAHRKELFQPVIRTTFY